MRSIPQIRFCNAFHPFHGFSMMSCGHIAEMNAGAIYIVGAQEPGYARGMGLKTRATFEEALSDAKKKFVGENPNILALPMTFKRAAVHLCMKSGRRLCGAYGHQYQAAAVNPVLILFERHEKWNALRLRFSCRKAGEKMEWGCLKEMNNRAQYGGKGIGKPLLCSICRSYFKGNKAAQ